MTSEGPGTCEAKSRGTAVVYETPQGQLTIRSSCPTDWFDGLRLDSGLGRFPHYCSIIQKPEAFKEVAARRGAQVTLAVMEPNVVTGYLACWYPPEGERWAAMGDLMYEMGAIEVSRNFRGLHIAHRMLELTLADDFFEDKIAFMQGLSWHWDLEGSRLTAAQYRQILMKLCSPFNFREVYTNEPNVALRVENIMMVRVGSRVSPDDYKRFRYLRFGINPTSHTVAR